ncbi:MAG: phenylalanine--tRNA ligase subunit beta [Dehalococcoidia bacterium]|nr:MAG: phenylalanine--tRNA ligase subunit beta [Dehalococcoidia bacterium]
MKVPLKWLKEYVNIDLPLAELANRLTMAGTETSLQSIGINTWQGVVIGEIADIRVHPNADRLSLVTVNLNKEEQTVVCGAPNLNVGDKIAFANVGTELINGYSGKKVLLKPAKIRGVTSFGMVCSEKELGISESHEGIMVLPSEAPLGEPLSNFLNDIILDLEVTPNRPDLLSIIGIAREIAALTNLSVFLPKIKYQELGTPIQEQVSIVIDNPDLCSRYCASLIEGIKIGESPEWLKQRLISCGMRPINNIVDATNYVMIEYGQPLHGFDFKRIKGGRITVRQAGENETIVTLDDVERKLDMSTLVIADDQRAVAIAGVMGGANSELNDETTSILLESANFNPANIHYTSHRLRLVSEASMRFERGIRPELAELALKRATGLIVDLAGGIVAEGIIDIYPAKKELKKIKLCLDEIERLLGVKCGMEQIEKILISLGFGVAKNLRKAEFLVSSPYWRSDVNIEADLVEEVARIIGYDTIPMTMLSGSLPQQNPEPILDLKGRVKQILVGLGFQEIIGYSLTSLEILEKALDCIPLEPKPLRLANSMTVEQEYLRTSLRGNLLTALATNLKHEEGAIRLFELGRVYFPRYDDLPDEHEYLCGIMSSEIDKIWPNQEQHFDFFAVKGVTENLLVQLGVCAKFEKSYDAGLYAGRQSTIFIDRDKIGVIGEVNPKITETFDISRPVFLFEINISKLLPFTLGHNPYQPIMRFPSVMRDIALVVDKKVEHQHIRDVITSFPLVEKLILFDVYTGKQIPADKKSLAYRIGFQSKKYTLTDKEVDRVQQEILKKLSVELGASLRR